MLHLFYQHKGLSTDDSAPASDRMPVQHLNIRYMRMFAGAFMYAPVIMWELNGVLYPGLPKVCR